MKIRFADLDLSLVSHLEQKGKVGEEFAELMVSKETQEKLEEAMDCMQALLGYIDKTACSKTISRASERHIQKLQRREQKGGFKIKGYYELKYISLPDVQKDT